MTKEEFLLKYSLNNSSASIHEYQHNKPLREAAVLIPLIDDGTQLNVLLTKRSLHLRHHAGQISFPGGKVETTDKDLIDTASRETFEEIGLPQELITIVGSLHSYEIVSGFVVTPYVGLIPNNYEFTKDINEVSEIFQVPLKHFLDYSNHITLKVERKSHTHNIHFMPYKEYNIWGATASMLKDLAIHLS
ncbi:CoA pyrophosphatase [Pseudocolwellia sp. HL-MZ19]|uniref:CoA pyrophosphatase n=1 Tax=Pseudocolwellia sp. HL-MZ19 TaxID=3400846 RepID=UPI003CEF8DE0